MQIKIGLIGNMRRKLNVGAVISLLMVSSAQTYAATVAEAIMPTGTLNISGKILDKGCTLEAKDLVIQLKPVVATAFTAIGDLGPKSDPVNFNLTGCPANSTLTFTVAGTRGVAVMTFATATESTNSSGLDFILYGPTSPTGYIFPNTPISLTTDSSGNYAGTISAQLRSNVAAPTAGKVDTTLTYTLAYN